MVDVNILSHQLKIRVPNEWVPLMQSRALALGFSDTTSGRSSAVSQWLKSLIAKEINMTVTDYHENRSLLWQSLSHELNNFREAFSANIDIDSSQLVRATYELGGLLQEYTRDDPRWWDESRPKDCVAHDDPIHELAHRAVHHAVYFLSLGDKVIQGETPPRGKAGNLIPKIKRRLERRRNLGLPMDWRDSVLLAGLRLCEAVTTAVTEEQLAERYSMKAIAEVDKTRNGLPNLPLKRPMNIPELDVSDCEEWLNQNCPTLNSLRNQKKSWPVGFVTFVRGCSVERLLQDYPALTEPCEMGPSTTEDEWVQAYCREVGDSMKERGRELLLDLEGAFSELARRTPVGANFKNLVRGASTEDKVIELLTEANVTNALSRLLNNPALSPQTNPSSGRGRKGKNCDLTGSLHGHRVWFEIKAYADPPPETGKARVRALSAEGYARLKDPDSRVERPRAWNLRNRLDGQTQVGKPPNGVPEQFKDHEINIVLVNERSWDAYQHLGAACFGDRWRLPPIDHMDSPVVFEDGLFAKERWKKVSAVALVTEEGDSIALRWCLNPRAGIPIPAEVLGALSAEFKPRGPLQITL